MDKFRDAFFDTKLKPQIFSLMIVVLILVAVSIVVFVKVKKQKPNQAPSGFLLIAEQYVMGVSKLYSDTTADKFTKPAGYIFTLLSFLLVSNLISLIGVEGPTSNYSVTLTLALIAWIGIFVVGIMYQKIRFFKKYLNPLEMITQFAPLISLSFRLFGNMVGGATIMYLIYSVTGWIWGMIPVIGEINLLGSIIAPPFHFYFDIFDGLIQAFVFTLLTMVYWSVEAEVEEKPEKKLSKKDIQKINKNNTNQKLVKEGV